jgi:hypothetical protein
VPELAGQADPVLKELNVLLDDDQLFRASSKLIWPDAFRTRLIGGGVPRR